MLKQPSVREIKPTWSRRVILSICGQIQFAKILLGSIVSVCMRDAGQRCFSCVLPLRNRCPLLPNVQHLENCCFLYFVLFCRCSSWSGDPLFVPHLRETWSSSRFILLPLNLKFLVARFTRRKKPTTQTLIGSGQFQKPPLQTKRGHVFPPHVTSFRSSLANRNEWLLHCSDSPSAPGPRRVPGPHPHR